MGDHATVGVTGKGSRGRRGPLAGTVGGSPADAQIKVVVGEDWIVQRSPDGELKIVLYIDPYHRFLPDSAPFEIS